MSRAAAPRRARLIMLALVACALTAGTLGCSGGSGDGGRGDGDDAGGPDEQGAVPLEPVLGDRADPLPVVTPTPRSMRWIGPDVAIAGPVDVVAGPPADEPTRAAVIDVLAGVGSSDVRVRTAEGSEDGGAETATTAGSDGERTDGSDAEEGAARVTVLVGSPDDDAVAEALAGVGVAVPRPLPAEGYALAAFTSRPAGDRGDDADSDAGTIVIAADDATGAFYGAQTLRQLATGSARPDPDGEETADSERTPHGDSTPGGERTPDGESTPGGEGTPDGESAPGGATGGTVAGVGVVDQPAMALRGTIEGFYGSPWTQAERLDQLAFHGRFKLNTYVYAPKDDPFHRDRWREPYPPDLIEQLRTLVEAATANHVRFTFAVSPGPSICYSDPAERRALIAKLQAVHDLGVRSFSIALDDIDHERWNCDGDAAAYGPASGEAAGSAQVALLNAVQADFVATHDGVQPLQMVPTEYRRTADSPYRTRLRTGLDPAVRVMWTGPLVVPAEITVAQAEAAAQVFGRPTLIWDNTPVNDFPPTAGRLLLGPYTRREPGLSAQVTGLVLNPMNQASASKVALIGGADFAWNDAAYDPARAHRAAAAHLAGGDEATIDALLAFFDVETLAPTSASDGTLAQDQAPALAAQLATFRAAWGAGDRAGAIAGLRPHAERLAAAPERIRTGVTDPGFVADAGPWLDATALWGRAFVATLDALDARLAGDPGTADAHFAEADGLVARAQSITTIAGETRPQGTVRVADGVLDTFLGEAHGLA